MTRHQGRTALYRLYGADERLLYIGVAANPQSRWRQHAEEKAWWPNVAIREVEWFPTRGEAENAECAEIGKHRPPENRDLGVKPATHLSPGDNDGGPGVALVALVKEYCRAVGRLAQVRDETASIRADLELEAVSVMRSGWSPYRLAKYLPWGEAHVRKLARAADIEPNERYRDRAAALRKTAPTPPATEED